MTRLPSDISAKMQRDFAKDFLEQQFCGKLPESVNAVKNLRNLIKKLPKDEKKFWVGTMFYPNSYLAKPLRVRIKIAMTAWVRGYKDYDGQCPFEFCGFNWFELKMHIESMFSPWMNWDNWGEWHIDHIIPRSLYGKPYSKEEVFGLKNLRPISAAENMAKGNRLN